MSKKKINVKLLRKVKALILAEPRRFNMSNFVAGRGRYEYLVTKQEPPCGTVACIAGWAVIQDALDKGRKRLTPQFIERVDIHAEEFGSEALGLNEEQAGRLFYASNWPVEFDDAYSDAMAMQDYQLAASAAARRIDHFIKTNGAE